MTTIELGDLLDIPATHQIIVGNRREPYSLGVTESPQKSPAFLLKIADPSGIPSSVTINGERIPVIVQGGFRAPVPLRG